MRSPSVSPEHLGETIDHRGRWIVGDEMAGELPSDVAGRRGMARQQGEGVEAFLLAALGEAIAEEDLHSRLMPGGTKGESPAPFSWGLA